MSFPEAVEAAGLRVKGKAVRGFMPRTEAVRLFVEHCGFVPRTEDLRFFATRQRFQMVDRGRRLHSEVLAEVAAQFEAEGKPWPERVRGTPPPEGWKEAAALATSPALDAARTAYPARKTEAYTLDEVVDGIRAAFDLCPPGDRLTVVRYAALSREHRLPQPSSVQRVAKKHGTSYGALVRQVARERAEAEKTA